MVWWGNNKTHLFLVIQIIHDCINQHDMSKSNNDMAAVFTNYFLFDG